MTDCTDITNSECISTREHDLKYMRLDLAEIAERWIVEEKKIDQSELEIRYQWAKDLRLVKEQSYRYGDEADEALYSLLVEPGVSLFLYQMIAIHIDDDFFDNVIAHNKSCTVRKGHITWSHLTYFIGVSGPEAKKSLFEECKAGRWSVAKLRERVDELTRKDPSMSTTEKRESGAGSIAKRVMNIVTQLDKQTGKILADEFSESLAKIRPGDHEETMELIGSAKVFMSNCIDQLTCTIEAIDQALETLRAKPEACEEKVDASANKTVAEHSPPAPRQPQAVPKKPSTALAIPIANRASSASATNVPQPKRPRKLRRRVSNGSQGSVASAVTLKM